MKFTSDRVEPMKAYLDNGNSLSHAYNTLNYNGIIDFRFCNQTYAIMTYNKLTIDRIFKYVKNLKLLPDDLKSKISKWQSSRLSKRIFYWSIVASKMINHSMNPLKSTKVTN